MNDDNALAGLLMQSSVRAGTMNAFFQDLAEVLWLVVIKMCLLARINNATREM